MFRPSHRIKCVSVVFALTSCLSPQAILAEQEGGLQAATVVKGSANADGSQQTVLTVAIPSINNLTDKISFLATTIGMGPAGDMVGGMIRSNTVGIDRTRPAGVVVTSDGEQLTPLGLVPVTDIKQFFDSMAEQFGEPEDIGDGIMELSRPIPMYIKQHDGWAIISQTEEALLDVSSELGKQLAILTSKYDLAVQGHMQHIPDFYREELLGKMNTAIDRQLDQLPDEQRELQERLRDAQISQWESLLNEVDEISFGWKIDVESKETYIDFKSTALPNTRLAQQYESLRDTSSKFTGFLKENASVTFNWAYGISEEDVQNALDIIQPLRQSTKEQLLNSDDLEDDAQRKAASHVVDILFDVLEQTIRTGKADGGGSLNIEKGNVSLMIGALVEDSSKLDAPLRMLAEQTSDAGESAKVEFDVDSHQGCTFHTISMAIQGNEAQQWIGDKVQVAVAIGEQEVYLSAGNDAIGQLKRAMDATAAAEPNTLPMQMYISLAPLLRLAAELNENPFFRPLADAFAASGESARISMIGKGVENGALFRLKIGSGVLEGVGRTMQAMQGIPAGVGAGQ